MALPKGQQVELDFDPPKPKMLEGINDLILLFDKECQ